MEAIKVMDLIRNLPLSEKIRIVEMILLDIKEKATGVETAEERMNKAAAQLIHDYQDDEELTAFTNLDPDPIYETR